MRKKVILLVLVTFALLLMGCDSEPTNRGSNTRRSAPLPLPREKGTHVTRAIGQPIEYIGLNRAQWVYNITIHESVKPMSHDIYTWPIGGNKYQMTETRGFLLARKKTEDGKLKLILKSKGRVKKQGRLNYPIGLELEVVRDDLGLYDWSENLYWAASTSSRVMLHEVVTYGANSPGAPTSAWGQWDQEIGSTMRIIFFGDRPMMKIGLADQNDALLFLGNSTVGGRKALHFRRFVSSKNGSETEFIPDNLDTAFTEDVWYERGVGLTKLVQKVGAVTTMTWKLER